MKMFIRAKLLMAFIIFFPLSVCAHYIEVTATTPFPSSVAATTKTLATYQVTNISAKDLLAINIGPFPKNSGFSVESTTCNTVLTPTQSCDIELAFNARWADKEVKANLVLWTLPKGRLVRYPLEVEVTHSVPQVTLEPIHTSHNKPQLQPFREPLVAEHDGKWLILSGSYGSFHDFENQFNPDIYVHDPKTKDIVTVTIADTDLPEDVKKQLASSVPVFLQDGDTLYIIGGYYNDPIADTYTTLNTVTIVDVPGMMEAVEQGNTHLKQFVAYCSENTTTPCPLAIDSKFKVTGGQLGKIGQSLYLTFGQDCEGDYCADSQTYSNAIYQFIATPNYYNNTIAIDNIGYRKHLDDDGSGWRRRDYTLTPFKWNGVDALFAMAGPFTPGDCALVWTNGIIFDEHLNYDNNFISQQGNQYANARLSMYSDQTDTSYAATFGGLSNLYWTTQGLVYNNQTNYGNILDLISADSSGDVREYVNLKPMCSEKSLSQCLYMGIAAEFIPVPHYFDTRGILQLDLLPWNRKTLVGYVYGGLISTSQEPFDDVDETFVTNKVYGVYVTPAPQGKVHWQNVTNVYTQN